MYNTPKTDWKSSDYFNIDDYNRIKNNLQYLKDKSLELYEPYEIINMGEDATYTQLPYASMINNVENNLETIATNTVGIDVGEKMEYSANSNFIDYIELNRLEGMTLNIFNLLEGQYSGRNRLRFKSGMKGVQAHC